jgi:hypothetical protein
MTTVQLTPLHLPAFGLPTVQPVITGDIYEARIALALERAAAAGFDALVVYGDREHFANITYLTGFDPRFEEALLILRDGHTPVLLVGVEGWGYASISPVEHKRVLFESFSLLGMPRAEAPKLETILREAGIDAGMRIGTVGWKYYELRETTTPESWLELPAYLVDLLRQITGSSANVQNATILFMNPVDGLRTLNEVEQLALLEFNATFSSQGVRNVLFGVKPGMTELAAAGLMGINGLPHNCHVMLSSGERAFMGLPSPSLKVIEHGDPFFTALGYWGTLNARGGFVVSGAGELPEHIRDYVDKLVAPYYTAIAEWYMHIGIGVRGGELYDIVHRHIGAPFFGVNLPPGHLIQFDEWVHSPIQKGSDIPLKSGMALQADVIPATGTPYFTTNIEDGIALADEALREVFAAQYPEAWGRIQARREFMQAALGIPLKPEVLPFSNIPAYLPPYLLNPTHAMKVV